MKCPNCGANIENNAKFCANCGNAIPVTKSTPINSKNFLSGIFDVVLSRPKLAIVILVVLIVIVGSMILFSGGSSSNQDYSSNGGYDMEIFNVAFHIPERFVESYHSGPSSSGETVDFKTEEYDDLEIAVSPYYNVNLKSNHVKVKYSKNIDGIDGTLVFYDSNRVSFYYKYGNNLIKLNTNSPDYEELFGAVIV